MERLETLFRDKPGIEENIIIERVQKTKPSPGCKWSKPRAIFCQFHNYKVGFKVLQKK